MHIHAAGKRNMGLDLLRAVAMLFVIIWHFIGQGGLLEHAVPGSGKYWNLSLVQILTICCVNLYGLTTGYLLCDKPFRLSRVTKLWVTTVFWSVAVSCVLFAVFPETRTFEEAVSMFLPILRGRYWFFTAYVVVMLLSPVLNLVIRSLSRGQFKLLLAVLFLLFGVIPVGALGNDVMRISAGHHFSWMIVLYILGGYLRRYGSSRSKSPRVLLGSYFVLSLAHLAYRFVTMSVGLDGFSTLLLTYPSPVTVAQAICLFLYFKDVFAEISADGLFGKLIRFAAPGVYSVYVIHVHPRVYWNDKIVGLFRAWDDWSMPAVCAAIFAAAAALFAACICLDALRQRLFRSAGIDRAVTKLSDRIEQRIRTLLDD